ncbi:transmembrane transport protein, partial [mine drainage metagenome]
YLRELRHRDEEERLDITGAVLVTGSLAAIIYAVVNTVTQSWTSTTTLAWLLGGLAGLAIFFWWEASVATHPLLPYRIFRSRALSTSNIVMFLVGGAFFTMWYFLTFYYQYVLGYGAVKTGVAFLPMALAIVAGAQLSSRILHRTHVRPLLLAGTALATVGFAWVSRIGAHSSYAADVLVPSMLCAFAIGLLFTPLASAATTGVDRAE